MSEELKACPFCGIKPELASLVTPVRYFCLCPNCGIGNELQGFDRDEARRFWNTRPIEDALRAEIARLSELLHDEMNQLEIATELGNKRWIALNEIYENGEKHNANWCKRKAQEGLGIK